MSGAIRLEGSTSGYSALVAPAEAGNQTFTFPDKGGTLLTESDVNPGVRYQSGTFTASYETADGTLSYTPSPDVTNASTYTRVGDLVTVWIWVASSGVINPRPDSAVSVAGMPYGVAAGGANSGPSFGKMSAFNASFTEDSPQPAFAMNPNGTNGRFLILDAEGGNQPSPLTAAQLFKTSGSGRNNDCRVSISYYTDDDTFVPAAGSTVTEDIQGTNGGGSGTNVNYNGASAWGRLATDGTLKAGQNVSIAKVGTGDYTVTFTTPMPNANYSIVQTSASNVCNASFTSTSESGFSIKTTNTTDGSALDMGNSFAIFASNAIVPQAGVGADAWVYCAADGTINNSFNIASVTKAADGAYDVVFTTPMPTADYSVTGSSYNIGDSLAPITFQYLLPTTQGFRATLKYYDVNTDSPEYLDTPFSFAVHASSTVTPTYTWTRDGITLKTANAGDSVLVGEDPLNTNNTAAGCVIQMYGNTRVISSTTATGTAYSAKTVGEDGAKAVIYGSGSAVFSGTVLVGADSWNGAGVGSRCAEGIVSACRDQGNQAVWKGFQTGSSTAKSSILANGTAAFTNSLFSLEPDNPANFNAEGEYIGPTLDVKDKLQKADAALTAIKAAASDSNTDLAGLKAAILAALSNH